MSKQWCGDLQTVNLYKQALFFKKRFGDVLGLGNVDGTDVLSRNVGKKLPQIAA